MLSPAEMMKRMATIETQYGLSFERLAVANGTILVALRTIEKKKKRRSSPPHLLVAL